MSKLVLVKYRISDAEERETRRRIALIRSMLERCARLQQDLQTLEPVAGENWSETLARYRQLTDASRWDDFVGDYNRLYDELPGVERQLEKELLEAKASRLRLELTATSLLASAATAAEKTQLEAITKSAGGLHGDGFREARSHVEELVRRRLDTPLHAADVEMTAEQAALVRELLADSPAGTSREPEVGDAEQAPYGADPPHPKPDSRLTRLVEQISGLDPRVVPVDDLLARLRFLPAERPAARGILLDSIAFEMKERLDAARRKREVQSARR